MEDPQHGAATRRLRRPRPSAASPTTQARSIGEVARASGVSVKMIRYYEGVGLVLPPARSAANYRYYDEPAVQTLRFIARSRLLGFTVEEIRRLLTLWRDPGRSSAEVKAVALAHAADLGKRIAAMQGMKAAVGRMASQCRGDHRPACPILDELSGASEGAGTRKRSPSDA